MDPFQDTPPADSEAPAAADDFNGFEDDAVVVGDDDAPVADDAESEELPNGNGIEENGAQNGAQNGGLPAAAVSDEVSAVNADMANMTVSETTFSPPRPSEEPETIRVWREQQKKRLEDKDENETKMMNELREQAKKELSDW